MEEGRSFQSLGGTLVLSLAVYSRVTTALHRDLCAEDAMGLGNMGGLEEVEVIPCLP